MTLVKKQTAQAIEVSPNAIKGSFRVKYPRDGHRDEISVDLVDAAGNVVEIPISVDDTSENSVDITISNTSSGIYYLKIRDGKTFVIKKIILQ